MDTLIAVVEEKDCGPASPLLGWETAAARTGATTAADARRRRSWIRTVPAAQHPPIVIEDAAQLSAFAASRAFRSRRPLMLSIPGMTQVEAFAAAEKLNKDRGECGCSLSAQAMTAGFAIATALLMMHYGAWTTATLQRLPLAIAIGLISAALGKIIGIAMGRMRARREVARILATILL
jgi:hypothetical protein